MTQETKEGMMEDEADAIVIRCRLRRDECPSLFANLAAVPKGPPRAKRLKVLTLRGFDAEAMMRGNAGQPALAATSQASSSHTSILSDLIEGKVE
jgi:hypothetical protein